MNGAVQHRLQARSKGVHRGRGCRERAALYSELRKRLNDLAIASPIVLSTSFQTQSELVCAGHSIYIYYVLRMALSYEQKGAEGNVAVLGSPRARLLWRSWLVVATTSDYSGTRGCDAVRCE